MYPSWVPSLVGKTLQNGMRVLEEVGCTREGPLYLADHPSGPDVALLVLGTEPAPEAHSRFRQAAEIRHRNVAVVHELGEIPEGPAYVVLERLDGVLLSEILVARGALPQDEALGLFLQIAAGLEAAHEVGLVHANLSPETILVTRTADGSLVKLIGFALPSSLPPALEKPIDREVGVEYASPERLAGYVPDYRSDVYSLGAVLHRLLVGTTPGFGSAGFASPAMRAAVVKAVMPIPEHRFHTVSQLVQAVQRAATAAPAPKLFPALQGRSTRRSLSLAVGTIVAVVAGGIGLGSLQGPGPAVGRPAEELETGTVIGDVPVEEPETDSTLSADSVVPQKAPAPRKKTAARASPKGVGKQNRARAEAAERALNGKRAKRTTLPSAPDMNAKSPASPPSASSSLEERAEVGRRIGLDEVSLHLGVPAHAIEGMSPLFLGLAQGRFPDGADPTAALVRGVYLDPNGSLILLDQQRIQSQPLPAATPTRWRMGDVMLYLHGDAQPGVLENLAKRVR